MVLADVKEKFVNLDIRLKLGIFLAIISFFTFFSSSKNVAVAVAVIALLVLTSKRITLAITIIFKATYNLAIALIVLLFTLFIIALTTVYFFT